MPQNPRLLFVSYHLCPDHASGASLSARDLLVGLNHAGWNIEVFCGPVQDAPDPPPLTRVFQRAGCPYTSIPQAVGAARFDLLQGTVSDIPLTIFSPPSVSSPADPVTGYAFINTLTRKIQEFRPHIVLTYGGHWLGRSIIAAVRAAPVPVAFWLRNCEYKNASFFHPVNSVLVPSQFTADFYRRHLGLSATPIPSPIDLNRIRCRSVDPRYLTFVNPHPAKGLHWFVALARQLAAARPDIPILVVQGRTHANALQHAGLDPLPENLRVMPNTSDPREFLAITRTLLVPSLWEETYARVSVEALINGIPSIASSRGALPEILNGSGTILDIPSRHTPHSALAPTPSELAPWIAAIARHWDDSAFYQHQQTRCRAAAATYDPAAIIARHQDALLETIRDADTSPSPVTPQHVLAALAQNAQLTP